VARGDSCRLRASAGGGGSARSRRAGSRRALDGRRAAVARARAARPEALPPRPAGREREAAELEGRLGLEPVKVDDARLARFLEEQGRLVRVGDGSAVSREAYESAREELVAECERAGSITLARFRDLLGSSRRPAQLLLERFDADGLTRRVGDERVLRPRAKRIP
jgi:selenocysteine-specific elongation factor